MTTMNLLLKSAIALIMLAALVFGHTSEAVASERIERRVMVGGAERHYIAHVPADAASRDELSVLFVFHPAVTNAEGFERIATLFEEPNADDFLIIYPNGIGRTWNVGDCCGLALKQNVDDLGFIDAIFDDAQAFGTISQKRNFATGFSNGAGMTHYLACNMPERFTAIAPAGGKRDMRQGCAPTTSPVSVFITHGLDDKLSPFGRWQKAVDEVTPAPSIEDIAAYWSEANQCQEQRTSTRLGNVDCSEATACAGESLVITCPIPNMGHWWPGYGTSQRWATIMYGPARPDLPAAEEILEFFRQQP
ncbi:MAG: hypothetical protein AAF213_09345 [Pseudomonadota bacterium]